MMSRGSFNGPGGQHTRWQIPPTQGSALGAQHNLRNKRFLNFIADDDILRLNRDGLAQTGLAVAEVKAREVAPERRPRRRARQPRRRRRPQQDLPARRRPASTSTCEGPWRTSPTGRTVQGRFNDYTMEVVQQIGSDSFAPGHGVLIGKSKTGSSTCGTLQLLRLVHRLQPAGHRPGRLRQGRRHAGQGDAAATSASSTTARSTSASNSGGEYEYVDRRPTSLHFYILDKRTDAAGHPALQGRRPLARGRGPADARRRAGRARSTGHRPRASQTCTFAAQEHGRRGRDDPTAAPAGRRRRTSTATSTACRRRPSGTGWTAHLQATRSPPRSSARRVQVPVYIEKATGAAANGSVTLTATSESDPTKTHVGDLLDRRERHRRRHGPGHARPDAWARRRQLRPVHAGRAEGLLRHHHGERHLDRR